jgi:hypothetical protein
MPDLRRLTAFGRRRTTRRAASASSSVAARVAKGLALKKAVSAARGGDRSRRRRRVALLGGAGAAIAGLANRNRIAGLLGGLRGGAGGGDASAGAPTGVPAWSPPAGPAAGTGPEAVESAGPATPIDPGAAGSTGTDASTLEQEEVDAAAAEAGAIGGAVEELGDPRIDEAPGGPAQDPVIEAGGGVSEGAEQTEADLIDVAESEPGDLEGTNPRTTIGRTSTYRRDVRTREPVRRQAPTGAPVPG